MIKYSESFNISIDGRQRTCDWTDHPGNFNYDWSNHTDNRTTPLGLVVNSASKWWFWLAVGLILLVLGLAMVIVLFWVAPATDDRAPGMSFISMSTPLTSKPVSYSSGNE